MDAELRKLLFSRRGRMKALFKALESVESGSEIGEGAIETKHIKDGAVTGQKISNGAVTASKIAEKGVTTARIDDKAITKSKVDLEVVQVVISGTETSGSASIADANSEILGVFQSGVDGGAGAIPVESVGIDAQNKKVELTIGEALGEGKSVTYTVVLLKS